MTYLWQQYRLNYVKTDRLGAPLKLRWQCALHPVDRVILRWRIDRDWWERRVWREYFLLITQSGLLIIIYQDLVSGEWYFERLYD